MFMNVYKVLGQIVEVLYYVEVIYEFWDIFD